MPQFAPGSKDRYSGEGYVYLSRVLEEVSGQGFVSLVQKRVLDPLAMGSSALFRWPEREGRMAVGHDRQGQAMAAKMS